MEEFRAWATLAIALVALIAPFAIWLWRNYFRRGTVDTHETFSIEIGFGSYGPTMGMNGTLRAIDRDLFIRSIDLIVTKTKDSSRYGFEWLVFRPASVIYGGPQETSIELPAGFLLTTAQPRRYNITFFDRTRQAEMAPHIQRLAAAWQEKLGELPNIPTLQQAGVDLAALGKTLYEKFSKEHSVNTETYSAIDRLFYWEPGYYHLKMMVNTTRPNVTFERAWGFWLTDQDATNLRQNVIKTVMTACGQDAGAFNFAYAQYLEP